MQVLHNVMLVIKVLLCVFFLRAQEHSVMLPALLVSHGPGDQRKAHSVLLSTLQETISHIRRAALDPFVRTSLFASYIIALNHFDLLNKTALLIYDLLQP